MCVPRRAFIQKADAGASDGAVKGGVGSLLSSPVRMLRKAILNWTPDMLHNLS